MTDDASNCTSTWGIKMSNHQSCHNYMGSICKNVLSDWHQCAIENGEVHVESIKASHVALNQEIMMLEKQLGLPLYIY